MKLSRSVRYAFTALVHLSQTHPHMPVMAKLIAAEHEIPLEYLLKILHQLTRSGILESIRGPQGGFCLNRRADAITLWDVIEAIDGPGHESENSLEKSGQTEWMNQLNLAYQEANKITCNYLKSMTLINLTDMKVR